MNYFIYYSLIILGLASMAGATVNETTIEDRAPPSFSLVLMPEEKLFNESDSKEQLESKLLCFLGTGYKEGLPQDYEKALFYHKEAAERGLAESQFDLGMMYLQGQGVEQDIGKAAQWFQAAADQGFASAEFRLGRLYYYGQGVNQDIQKAFDLYKAAAKQEIAEAQNNLGLMYEEGQGIPRDYTMALYWYEKAVQQGFAAARFNLARMHLMGRGVKKDAEKASEVLQQRTSYEGREKVRKLLTEKLKLFKEKQEKI